MRTITAKQIKAFQKKILKYYDSKGRELPWRKTRNRYNIFVSEIMLQQTQVSRVIEKYKEWLKAFPTVQKLAEAKLSDVLRVWSGLGYNSRGKRLWEAAKIIVEQYKGKAPQRVEELIALPGIGPYTARSILIFADNRNIATVDTNIRRIFIHEFKLSETIPDKDLFMLAEKILPKGKSRDWHNALMDYGSHILTSKETGIRPKTQQSKFKGSRREYRAKIIKYLTQHQLISLAQAKKEFSKCSQDLKSIFEELEKEELIKKEKQSYSIQ